MRQTIKQQLETLQAKRNELHAEMVNGLTGRVDSQWFADRVNEMAHLNKSFDRLMVLAASSTL